jgi:hypothetical protein
MENSVLAHSDNRCPWWLFKGETLAESRSPTHRRGGEAQLGNAGVWKLPNL